jgi:hypothetical protein
VTLLGDASNLALHGARVSLPSTAVSWLRERTDRPVIARIVPQQIAQVVLNFLSNAFYAVTQREKQDDEDGYRPQVAISLGVTLGQIETAAHDAGANPHPTSPSRSRQFCLRSDGTRMMHSISTRNARRCDHIAFLP